MTIYNKIISILKFRFLFFTLILFCSPLKAYSDTRSVEVKITSSPPGMRVIARTASNQITSLGFTPIERSVNLPAGQEITIEIPNENSDYEYDFRNLVSNNVRVPATGLGSVVTLHVEFVNWKRATREEFGNFSRELKRELLKALNIYNQVYTSPLYTVNSLITEGKGLLDEIRFEYPEFKGTYTERKYASLFAMASLSLATARSGMPSLTNGSDTEAVAHLRSLIVN